MNPPPARFVIGDTSLLSLEQLAQAVNATFDGYFMPVKHTALTFGAFCRQYSLDVGQSVLMDDETGQLVGLTMLGLRAGLRGWCGGFGIVPGYRGRGLSDLLVNGLLDRARELGLVSLQLEVLTQNERAFKTYQKAGFQTTRQMLVLSAPVTALVTPARDSELKLREVDVLTALQLKSSLDNPVRPCWQREAPSLHAQADLRALVAERGEQVLGVLLFRYTATSGQLSLLDLTYRDENVVALLLEQATRSVAQLPTSFYLLNEPENSPLLGLLTGQFGFQETSRQHEMVIAL